MRNLNITIPGLSISCKIWGNANNPPILALHGWLDNANSFDYIAPYLEKNFYFIAIDLPGHGHSSHLPLGCHYHFTDGVFVIIEILNALNLDKVHLLGHSMGACLGSLVAGVAPDRFQTLGLIEGLGPFSNPGETACKQLAEYSNYLSQRNTKKPKGYDKFEKAALARALTGYVSLEIAKTLCERSVKEENGQFFWKHDRRLLVPSPLYLTEEQVLSCLKQITARTYLFWASKGFPFDSEMMRNRIDAIKNIKVEHLKGGHHIHMEQPEIIANLLAEFCLSI